MCFDIVFNYYSLTLYSILINKILALEFMTVKGKFGVDYTIP